MVRIAAVLAAAPLLVASALGYTGAQRERGALLYERHCATCHGGRGEGGAVPASVRAPARRDAPPLAGPGALRRFADAAELVAYVKYDMPPQAPGALASGDALDVVAFLLSLRGLAPDDAPLTLARAGAIALPGAPPPAPAGRQARSR